MIVIDASVLVPALADDGHSGDRARLRMRSDAPAAPELIDLETASAVRRLERAGTIDPSRAEIALGDLATLPLLRASHRALLARCWELRDNLTIYDAAYVALAEARDVVLVTADARLARAPGRRCEIELLG